jgi:periplasmic copper chaperone A
MKRTSMLALAFLVMTAALSAAPALVVKDEWVREPNPARPMTAAYMTLVNEGDTPVTLVGASSKACEVVELHEMATVDGVMRMRMIQKIEVPARSTVRLEPGGLHLMLIRLTGGLKAGDAVEIELKLEGGESIVVTAPVKTMESHH